MVASLLCRQVWTLKYFVKVAGDKRAHMNIHTHALLTHTNIHVHAHVYASTPPPPTYTQFPLSLTFYIYTSIYLYVSSALFCICLSSYLSMCLSIFSPKRPQWYIHSLRAYICTWLMIRLQGMYADIQTCKHAYMQTYACTDIQTCRHTDIGVRVRISIYV